MSQRFFRKKIDINVEKYDYPLRELGYERDIAKIKLAMHFCIIKLSNSFMRSLFIGLTDRVEDIPLTGKRWRLREFLIG